jgi:hypothetical protein
MELEEKTRRAKESGNDEDLFVSGYEATPTTTSSLGLTGIGGYAEPLGTIV